MSDRNTPTPAPNRHEAMAPETHNSEQDMRGEQAQDVAVDARQEKNGKTGGTESRKASSPGVDNVAGHETDLIDVMRKMENTGAIDNGAFSGEPDHDDEPSRYHDSGATADENPDNVDPDQLRETRQP